MRNITVPVAKKAYSAVGLKPIAGKWFKYTNNKVVGCCPGAAVLIAAGKAEVGDDCDTKLDSYTGTYYGHGFVRGVDGQSYKDSAMYNRNMGGRNRANLVRGWRAGKRVARALDLQ